MAQEVKMPQMGESIAEGTVTTWLKKVGDSVERDEPLFEISTDKVDAEIPSPLSGTLLEIKVEPGQTVPIDTVVAVIGAAGEAAGAPAPAAETAKPAAAAAPAAPSKPAAAPPKSASAPPKPAAGSGDERGPKSSPVVRKIAAEHAIDVSQLQGSGIGGRVTKEDILSHLEGGGVAPTPSQSPPHGSASTGHAGHVGAVPHAGAPASRAGMLADTAHVPEAYRPRVFDGDKVEELNTMRAKIAEHMVISKRISAHVGTVFEVDFSHVVGLRQKHKAVWEERFGVNLTFTAFIMKAAVDALKKFSVLNASLDGNKVILHRDVNLGLAVALDWGLIVPVIHKADELSTLGLARRAADLAARARTKKLKPDEVQAGTFTITNPGIYGPMFNMPVINQPQVAILGVGAVEKRPVVIGDAIAIRTRAYLSLSFDHRLIDGAVADQFMATIKAGIEGFDAGGL